MVSVAVVVWVDILPTSAEEIPRSCLLDLVELVDKGEVDSLAVLEWEVWVMEDIDDTRVVAIKVRVRRHCFGS